MSNYFEDFSAEPDNNKRSLTPDDRKEIREKTKAIKELQKKVLEGSKEEMSKKLDNLINLEKELGKILDKIRKEYGEEMFDLAKTIIDQEIFRE